MDSYVLAMQTLRVARLTRWLKCVNKPECLVDVHTLAHRRCAEMKFPQPHREGELASLVEDKWSSFTFHFYVKMARVDKCASRPSELNTEKTIQSFWEFSNANFTCYVIRRWKILINACLLQLWNYLKLVLMDSSNLAMLNLCVAQQIWWLKCSKETVAPSWPRH